MVRSGEHEAGPYEESEVEALVRKGLRDAVVKREGGSWVHLSASPFAGLIPRAPDTQHFGWKLVAVVALLFTLWFLWRFFGHPSVVIVN